MPVHGQGFIACAKWEETVKHFGEGSSPELALADFVNSGEFNDYCDCNDIKDESHIEVRVFRAVYSGTPEASQYELEDGWDWILADQVYSKIIQYLM